MKILLFALFVLSVGLATGAHFNRHREYDALFQGAAHLGWTRAY
jgi:hypothetical protein